jgi:hypothetical protein
VGNVSLGPRFCKADGGSLGPATDAIALPQTKPRAAGLFLIVPLVRCHKVAGSQRPLVRNGKDAFQPLDLGNGPFGVHLPNIYQNSTEVK